MSYAFIRPLVVLPVIASLSGCGTAFIGTRVQDTKEPKDQAALRYHLPEDVVEIIVTLERTTSKRVVGTPDKPEIEVQDTAVALGASVNLQTIADTSTTYLLDASAASLSKNNTAISVTETGLLQSVNAKSAGAGGVVFENVMKIAGTVMPLVNLAQGKFSAPPAKTMATETIEDIRISGANFRNQSGFPTAADSRAINAAQCQNEQYLFNNYFPNTPKYRYAFKDLVRKKDLIAQFCDTLGYVTLRRSSYRGALSELDAARQPADIKALSSKVDKVRFEYDNAVAAHTAARTAITTAVDDALQQKGIGSKSERYTQRAVMHLSQLPPRAAVADLSVTASGNQSSDKVDDDMRSKVKDATLPNAIAGQPATRLNAEVVDFFASTGIIVTAEPLSAETNVTEASVAQNEANACGKIPCVFYRSPRPYLLSSWTVQTVGGAVEQRRLVQSESKIIDAIADGSAMHAIALRDSTFTKRDSTLAFSARGRITGLTRDYGSAAEDASSSIAAGLTGAVTQYGTTLNSVKTIRATENELELQPLQHDLAVANARSALNLQPIQAQITSAQQQLALLNSQTQLDSATQGQKDALQAQLTSIQNTLVNAQAQLVNSQSAVVSAQANAANTQEQAAITNATSMLKAQIEQLNNEVQLLKLKQELADLKKE